MELIDLMKNRRSIRSYTREPIPEEKLERVLQAGLLSMSGRGRRPWELVLVRDRQTLEKLSVCREGAAAMLAGAGAAVVVFGIPECSDTWVEDCAIVMENMHLMAESLGLGSCWIQGRMRETPEHTATDEYVRGVLHAPDTLRLEAILSLGVPAVHPEGYSLDSLPWEKVHRESL